MAIENEFVEESGWAISRIRPRNGGVDLGGVEAGRGGQSRQIQRVSICCQRDFSGIYSVDVPLCPAATRPTFSKMTTISL